MVLNQEENQTPISRPEQEQISGPISHPDQGSPDNQFDCPECGKSFGAQKSVEAHMLRSHRIKPSSLGGGTGATEKVTKDDGESLVADIRAENTVASNALLLSRNKSRLRQQDPHEFRRLYGHEEDGSPTRAIVDLEIAKTLRNMREEETEHRNNGGGSEASEGLNLRKEIDALRQEMHQKEIETLQKQSDKLEAQIAEMREDMRHSTNSNSDLAVLVKETSSLIGKALESPGVVRSYLLPDGSINIKDKKEAPLLTQPVEPASRTVVSELSKHGLVTRFTERQST